MRATGQCYSAEMPHAPADAALVKPAARVAGRLRVPGDKSISHRYAMLAALADGRSNIQGYLTGADCLSTLDCLRALGVTVRRTPESPGNREIVQIDGRGARGLTAPTGAARCRQLGHDDASDVRDSGGARVPDRHGRRQFPVPAADEARDSAPDRDGGDHRIGRWPAAPGHQRRPPPRHHPSSGGPERADQERRAPRRSAGRRRDDRARARGDARSHRARVSRIWRRGCGRSAKPSPSSADKS